SLLSLRPLVAIFAACVLSTALFAQNDQNNAGDNGGRRQRRNQNGDPNAGNGNGNGRGNFDPAQMQERMMTALRDQFGVKDDAEWNIIQERLTKVMELRRGAQGGMAGLGAIFGRGGNNPNAGG